MVKEKPKGKSESASSAAKIMKENIWKITSMQDESVYIEVDMFFGSTKPEHKKIAMDEFVVCWEKHVVIEDLVYGIVVRVRRVMFRLL